MASHPDFDTLYARYAADADPNQTSAEVMAALQTPQGQSDQVYALIVVAFYVDAKLSAGMRPADVLRRLGTLSAHVPSHADTFETAMEMFGLGMLPRSASLPPSDADGLSRRGSMQQSPLVAAPAPPVFMHDDIPRAPSPPYAPREELPSVPAGSTAPPPYSAQDAERLALRLAQAVDAKRDLEARLVEGAEAAAAAAAEDAASCAITAAAGATEHTGACTPAVRQITA